jgi:DNA polymerase-3 subunit gamma/tau
LQQGFDMCMLRMLAFKPLPPQQQVVGQDEPIQQSSPLVTLSSALGQPEVMAVETQPVHTQEPEPEAPQPIVQAIPAEIESELATDDITLDDEPDLIDEPLVADFQEEELFAEEFSLSVEPTSPFELPLEVEAPPAEPLLLEPETEPTQPEASVQAESVVEEPTVSPDTELLPQQILRHKHVELVGEWNIEKWECWLREAPLNMAQRNLAQHGLMLGEIGGQSTFVIEESHHLMAKEFIDGLVDVLKQQWPDCKVELNFQTISEPTPLLLKDIRAAQALQQADMLLKKEPVVASLIQQFSATLSDVQLKD